MLLQESITVQSKRTNQKSHHFGTDKIYFSNMFTMTSSAP